MKNIIFITFVLFLSLNSKNDEKEFYSVIAENGLIVRNEPKLNSIRIGKLECGEDILLLEKTNKELSITDKGKILNGFWYKIQSDSVLEGYVFNYFLLKKSKEPIKTPDWSKKIKDNSSNISTDHFDLTIYNYSLSLSEQEYSSKKKDTLLLYEEVFNEIGDKLIKLKPKKKILNIEVFYTRLETLNDWGTIKNSDSIMPKWKGHKSYIKLESTNDFYYRIPITDYKNIRESTAQELNLERAPNWNQIGEGWWIPRYKYKGIIAPYEIKSIILKIILTYPNNEIETKLVEIQLSYGC